MLKKVYDFYGKHKGKVVEFLLMYAVTFTFAAFGYLLSGILLAILIGLAKEAYDKVSGGTFSLKDLTVDAVGIVIGILITILHML